MTNLPGKKNNRLLLFGCLGPLFTCLALALVMVIAEPIKSVFNLCDITSPAGCQNIYRVGGEINLGKTLALSADGRFLAIGNRDLLVLDTETGKIKTSILLQSDPNYPCEVPPTSIAMSPKGEYVAGYTFYDNCVFLLNIADGSLEKLQGPTQSAISVDFIAFSPDGTYLFYTHPDGNLVYRYDLAQKRSEEFLEGRGPLDISPQGLMAVAVGKEIQLWRLTETPQLEQTIPLEMQEIAHLAISPDEKILAVEFYINENKDRNSQVVEIASGKILADKLDLYNMAFSPDGKFLMDMNGPSSLYRVNQDGTLAKTWRADRLVFTIYDPFGLSTSNLVLDTRAGWMYYGEQGSVARFRIP